MTHVKIKNHDTENTIWGFLKKEIWLIGIVISAVLAIYVPISKIQTDIATIQTNHEAHMQEALEAIKNLQQQHKEIETKFLDLYQKTTENQTLIKTHMGIK